MNSFNPLLYLAINPDIKGVKPHLAYRHYLDYGIKEGRFIETKQLYNNFRSDIYLSLNMDLANNNYSHVDLQVHWLKYGRYEKRQYKPTLAKNIIYLYTDDINKDRCKAFSKLLDSIGIINKIEECAELSSNNYYILFTINNITTYPFYYVLNLLDYRINSSILETSIGICINPQNILVPLGKYTDIIYYLQDPNCTEEYLLKRLLFGIDFLDKIDIQIIQKNISIITNLENREGIDIFNTQNYIPNNINFVYVLKKHNNIIGYGQTIKCIIESAKIQDLPYVIICNDTAKFSQEVDKNLETIINYLTTNNNWDLLICVDESEIINITDVIEIIQIFKNIEIARLDKYIKSSFYIFNNTVYDKIIEWNIVKIPIGIYLSMLNLNVLVNKNNIISL
jgi:hypothetical protein